ncbi:MAG: endonuclease V [Candidatus Aminicenantes bacterium]|nr:endonuclease V [Candidatus Aminicenantes bacterium]
MDYKRAAEIQIRLASMLKLKWEGKKVRTVAGADFSYDRETQRIGAKIIVFDAEDMRIVDSAEAIRPVRFPYVPGFLLLREAPSFFQAFRKLNVKPDLTLIDGNGIAHPRKMGLASYVGVALDICTVGCAKNPFFPYVPPSTERGSMTDFFDRKGEKVGVCVRTRSDVKPVFVSPGHRVDIENAVKWVLRCAVFRIPEPIRKAHFRAKDLLLKK